MTVLGRTVLEGLALVVEVTLLVFVLLKARRVLRQVRASRILLVDALEEAMGRELPRRLGAVLATEVAALVYAFGGWWRPTPTVGFSTHSSMHFSTHRERSYLAVIGILGFLVAVETAGLHLILHHVSTIAAWIATGLSLYTLLWLVGDAQAVRLHPIVVDDAGLALSQGIRWRTEVPFAVFEAAEAVDTSPKEALRMGHLGTNVLLRLREPVTVRGPFGMRRRTDRIGLMVDGRDRFLAEIARRRELLTA